MAVRLCQQCCQWVWSRSGLCPDCQDLLSDEINRESIASRARNITGAVLRPLGHVALIRKRLPNDGVLYLTEQGLFFLPHHRVLSTQLVEEKSTSLLWRLATAIWLPLWLLTPFMRRKRIRAKVVEEVQPICLNDSELQLLPDLLPRIPGTYFIAARDVSTMRHRGRRWTIDRFNGPALLIEPVNANAFKSQIEDMTQLDAWRMALLQ